MFVMINLFNDEYFYQFKAVNDAWERLKMASEQRKGKLHQAYEVQHFYRFVSLLFYSLCFYFSYVNWIYPYQIHFLYQGYQ